MKSLSDVLALRQRPRSRHNGVVIACDYMIETWAQTPAEGKFELIFLKDGI